MDIVYPLGNGSRWQNRELFYSILSVIKHLKGFNNIYIIGAKPDWSLFPAPIANAKIIHIPHKDIYTKDTNICYKILRACEIKELSNDFVFMNDDVFFCNDIHVNDIPDSWVGTLIKRSKQSDNTEYGKLLLSTHHILSINKKPVKDFDGHMPIVFNKFLFPAIAKKYNWHSKPGYVVKSIYFNHLNLEGTEMRDLKISMPGVNIPALLKNRWCFSVGDNGLTDEMKTFLKDSFLP